MSNKLINILIIILFIIPFSLLIVDTSVLFPYITTKALFFRILVTVGIFLVIWLYLLNPETLPKKNLLFLSSLIFLGVNLIAVFFSVNPYRSFWGNAERMEGWWSMFFYFSYFFLLFTLFQFSPYSKKIILFSFLIVTSIISIVEITEGLRNNILASRPHATLGNATYIGFMNLLTIFLLLYFYFQTKSFSEKVNYVGVGILNFLSMLISQTRGSILGLLLGMITFIFLYIIFFKIELKKKLLFFLLFFLSLFGFYLLLRTEIVLSIPGLKRIAETIQNPVSVFPRLFAWKIFLNAFKEKPLLGWGLETLPVAFFSYFDPQIFYYEKAIFDRPHNKFIEVLVSTGLIGFFAWLFFLSSFVYYVLKNIKENLISYCFLLSFLVAYLGQNFTLFDMQASYLLFFFGISLIVPKVNYKENTDRFIRPYLILIGGICLVFLVIHLQHYYIVNRIIAYLREQNLEKSGQQFLRISNIAGPFLTEEAFIASNHFFANLNNIKNGKTFDYFYRLSEKAWEKDKTDYRLTGIYLGYLRIIFDIESQMSLSGQDTKEKAINIYNDLISRYKLFPEGYINYANFLFSLGEKEKAKEILKKSEIIATKYPPYYFQLANIFYNQLGDYQEAYYYLTKLNTYSFKFNEKDYELALKIYLSNGDKKSADKLIYEWKKISSTTSTQKKIEDILNSFGFKEK